MSNNIDGTLRKVVRARDRDTPRRKRKQAKKTLSPEPNTRLGFSSVESWLERVDVVNTKQQLIQELLPEEGGAYGVIAGRTGIGKTNLSLYLAFCLATGKPFLGLRCEKVAVVFLAFEGGKQNLRIRIEKIKDSFPPTEGRLHFDKLPIQNPIKALEEVVKKLKNTDVRVVIIDPIKYLVPGNYLKPSDVDGFVSIFNEILLSLNMNAIITLPISKPQDPKGLIRPNDIYSIKGATEWVDSATFGLLLEKRAYKNDEVTLSFAKLREAEEGLIDKHLKLNRKTCIFEGVFEFETTDHGTTVSINVD